MHASFRTYGIGARIEDAVTGLTGRIVNTGTRHDEWVVILDNYRYHVSRTRRELKLI